MDEQRIEIPKVVYQGDDKKLKERVSKFKAGSFRIAVFTVVGCIMGAYSHIYTSVGFLPIKVLLAIPYKINEAIYVSIIGTDSTNQNWYWNFTEFFPHSIIATFLAEVCTTILIGGAIYGSLAYFSGDKRVFTLGRYMKFGAVWCAIILTAVGMSYFVNAKAIYDNENLKGDPVFTVVNSEGRGCGIGGGEAGNSVKEIFYSELEERAVARDLKGELPLRIVFDSVRYCVCGVNYEKQYLVTEKGRTYHISADFAQIIRRYEEEGVMMHEGVGVEIIK